MFKSRIEAFKYLNEWLGPQKYWPRTIRMTLYKKHLTNQDRFKCIVFLLCNGVNPAFILPWFLATGRYDDSAVRHIKYVIDKYPTSTWKAWNLSENKSL